MELEVEDLQGYESVFYMTEKLDWLLWYFSVMKIGGDPDSLNSFMFPLNSYYMSKIRDSYFEEYLLYKAGYMKISVSDALKREGVNKKSQEVVEKTPEVLEDLEQGVSDEEETQLRGTGDEKIEIEEASTLVEDDYFDDDEDCFIVYTTDGIVRELDTSNSKWFKNSSDSEEDIGDDASNWGNGEDDWDDSEESSEEGEDDDFSNFDNWGNDDEEDDEWESIASEVSEEDEEGDFSNFNNWGSDDEDEEEIEEPNDDEDDDFSNFDNWGNDDEEDSDDWGNSSDDEDDDFSNFDNWGNNDEEDEAEEELDDEDDFSNFDNWGNDDEEDEESEEPVEEDEDDFSNFDNWGSAYDDEEDEEQPDDSDDEDLFSSFDNWGSDDGDEDEDDGVTPVNSAVSSDGKSGRAVSNRGGSVEVVSSGSTSKSSKSKEDYAWELNNRTAQTIEKVASKFLAKGGVLKSKVVEKIKTVDDYSD